ncbi:bifunctional DNA primase/polymerase [Modestobacter sp. VKM Ac-2978]|uniref:bifunctional DNA primase/polymerase n=1 Tax=Modestobacter sp. VKM Ac-2978 TaxID=3004132 RepID=UPI0022AB115B|nr:bifunctional DNA primase/polymerase [Modestobacter sp. VKM Ac-2978]MCZ2850011.1 bifunctional DNA primase/polymerase [Modestobacter sp. VKM Ac-2978]
MTTPAVLDTRLGVPALAGDVDTLTAALAYAKAGFYVLPVKAGTKEPGGVIGKGWQRHSSRDPEQIVAWFAGTNYGIALHAGRSGAVVIDVDDPQQLPSLLVQALIDTAPPMQATRRGDTLRGHYLFAMPPGRLIGNSTGRLGRGWGDVRGRNGVNLVVPSQHPAEDGDYRWLRTGELPELPVALADALDDALDATDAATDAQVAGFLAEHTATTRPRLLDTKLRSLSGKLAGGDSRHQAMVGFAVGAMKEARAGYYAAADAADRLRQMFIDVMTSARVGDAGARVLSGSAASVEFDGILAWAVGQAVAADLADVHARVADLGRALPVFVAPAPAPAVGRSAGLQALAGFVEQLRGWQDLSDPGHVLLALAAAVTRDLDGEPVWLLLVAPPSSGKTETVRLLDDVADGHLDDVTAAGLLSWSKHKSPVPAGVLVRIGRRGLLTFGDLSSLLANSNQGGRDQVFGMMRRVYDGHVSRDVSPPGRVSTDQTLTWDGRATVVAAVTGAIDRQAVHNDQLGPRWVYVRLPDRDTPAKRRAAALARRGELAEHRAAARATAAQLVTDAARRAPAVVIPETVHQAVEDAALVTCWGRAAVPRSGYGSRQIEDLPTIEEPMRLIRQLLGLARGLSALGLSDPLVISLLRRVALDSMPAARRTVLATLALGEPLTTAGLAREASIDRKVARFQAEELQAIGVVHGHREGDQDVEDDNDKRPITWRLASDDGALIADVLADHRRDLGWDEIEVSIPPSPQEGSAYGVAVQLSSHYPTPFVSPFTPLSAAS